jgi:hypothetical protein
VAPPTSRPTAAGLPRSALLAAWLGAWLRGEAAADDVVAVVGPLPQVVTGLPGAAGAEPLVLALGRLRTLGATTASVALPVAGDPAGLGGPTTFNTAALDAGEAVVVGGAGLGLVPVTVGGAVEWRSAAADPPPWIDLAEASVGLRTTLLDVTRTLVDLDVATWQPEIPDALMNLRHRSTPPLPSTYDARRVETVDRALLCREIVALAAEVEAGAVSAAEVDARRAALTRLDRAARQALVATCR